jgi:hypothetical protein
MGKSPIETKSGTRFWRNFAKLFPVGLAVLAGYLDKQLDGRGDCEEGPGEIARQLRK